ncbi:unannotated protein [freshwater metagenome]|uniref:Unannotated protein n=1 Tax=freshwater metagenome TaxID=449393 RepID=A0A6J6NJJ5_9ZZZZ
MRTRGSAPTAARSSSFAISIFLAVSNASRVSSHSSCSTMATPSGSASPAHSSTLPNVAFSRASASTSRHAVSSSVPACDEPVRPSLITRTLMPWLCAETKCSRSPLYTRISVSRDRATFASICSPGSAIATMASAIACRSSTVWRLMLQCHQW